MPRRFVWYSFVAIFFLIAVMACTLLPFLLGKSIEMSVFVAKGQPPPAVASGVQALAGYSWALPLLFLCLCIVLSKRCISDVYLFVGVAQISTLLVILYTIILLYASAYAWIRLPWPGTQVEAG